MTEKMIICQNRIRTKTEKVPASKLTWRPSVYGILIKDDKVLLSKQWDGWDFPGGGIEKGESVEEALLREVKEETGLTVESDKLFHITENFFIPDYLDDTYWHSLLMYFTCKNPQGEISTEGFAKHEQKYMGVAEWVPLDQIDSLKFYNVVDSPALIRMAS